MRRLRQAAGLGDAVSLRYHVSEPQGEDNVDVIDVSNDVPQTRFYDLPPRHRLPRKPFCLGLARDLAHGAENAAKSPSSVCRMAEDGGAWADAKQNGGAYSELLAEAARHISKEDWSKAAWAFRELIVLRPDEAAVHFNLAAVLSNSGHKVEAVQRFLAAQERAPMDSKSWAVATASAYEMIRQCQTEESDVGKPEWWNDAGLKLLSARVVRAAPNNETANTMRADVLSLRGGSAWQVGSRSATEIKEAAAYYERAASMSAAATDLRAIAGLCRSQAEAMCS